MYHNDRSVILNLKVQYTNKIKYFLNKRERPKYKLSEIFTFNLKKQTKIKFKNIPIDINLAKTYT